LVVPQSSTAQTPAPTPQGAVPDLVLYQALFQKVTAQNKFGDRLDAEKKDSSRVRSGIRDAAGLTKGEYQKLEAIAKEYAVARAAFFGDRHARLHSQDAAALSIQKLQEQQANFDSIVSGYITRLIAELGPTRSQVLASYVHSTIAPKVSYHQGR
jgi:hypothetical protein